MNQRDGQALDHMLTEPPAECDEDGHSFRFIGTDEEGTHYFKCRRCGKDDEQ